MKRRTQKHQKKIQKLQFLPRNTICVSDKQMINKPCNLHDTIFSSEAT